MMSLLRWIQFGIAIAGLILAASSKQINAFLVFAFVLALVYHIILVISWAIGREVFSVRGETIADLVVAIIVLIAAIYVTVNGLGDVISVLAIVCGYVLPALLFITAIQEMLFKSSAVSSFGTGLMIYMIMVTTTTTIITTFEQIGAVAQLISTSQSHSNRSFDANLHRDVASSSSSEDGGECFEDRLEAIEVGRQCSRRCKKDVPCENARKQCLCDGLCGMSCLKPDLNCPELPKLEHGDYGPKSTRFNSRVQYQCESGYYLFGSRERLCQGDEDWSGTPAECLAEPQCRNPIRVNHARNPSDGIYQLGDKVDYSCYPGYQSRGNSEATCKLIKRNQLAWVWSGEPFRCIPKSCGDPGNIENGKRHGDSFIIASSVLYTCNEGFEMNGQARRYCQSDNQWSGQPPQCEPITCNPTDHLENGKINYAYPLTFNSTVEYSCDLGFRLIGPSKRRCGPERKLVGEVPVCSEIDCGELGPLDNGYIKGYSNRMGDKKEFTCREGMKFVGNHTESVCLETGQWSHPLPKCLAPCLVPRVQFAEKIFILKPEMIEQSLKGATLKVKSAEIGSLVNHESYIEILCQKDYEFEKMMNEHYLIQAPYCNNSTWSYEPRCKPASCRAAPPVPPNGRVRVASIEHGSKGFIYCLDGYRLKGNNTTNCIKGEWSKANSTCAEVYCSFPGYIEHGRVLLVGLTGMYDYKPYMKRITANRQIAFECDSGYRLNDGAPGGATCIDGQWKPDGLPSCIKE